MKISPCPNCGSANLFRSREVSAGGGYAPNYLPDLGGFFRAAKFRLVMCRDCRLVRFFASPEAAEELANSDEWERLQT